MAEEYVEGKDLILYKWNTVDTEWEPVACATDNSFETTLNFLESITKCDESTRRRPTSKNYTSSISGLVSTKASQISGKVYSDILQEEADNMTKSWYAIYTPEVTDKTFEKYFEAYINSISFAAAREDNMTFDAELAIDGDAVNTDPFATT